MFIMYIKSIYIYFIVVSCWYTCNSYVLSMLLADSDLVTFFFLQLLVASLSMRRLVTTGLVNCSVFDELEFYKCWVLWIKQQVMTYLKLRGTHRWIAENHSTWSKRHLFLTLVVCKVNSIFGLAKYVDWFLFDNLVCLFCVSWFLHCLPCCFNNILEMTWNLRYLESMLADGLKGEKYVTWVCS